MVPTKELEPWDHTTISWYVFSCLVDMLGDIFFPLLWIVKSILESFAFGQQSLFSLMRKAIQLEEVWMLWLADANRPADRYWMDSPSLATVQLKLRLWELK